MSRKAVPLRDALADFADRHGVDLHAPVPPLTAPTLDEQRLAACDRARQLAARRWAHAIPPRFLDAELDHVDEPHRTALSCWSGVDGSLLLTGPIGTGKTYAACAAVRPRVEQGASLAFWPVIRLLDELRPGNDSDPYAAAATADVLVLDDLGAERPTDWTRERLYALVNDRWLAELPIVVTTNLTPPQLADAVGERLSSRLLGGSTIARLSGVDRRMQP